MKFITNKSKVNMMLNSCLLIQIKTEYVYEDFYQDKNLFNFSDYPLDSTFFDPVNKNVICKIKDEFQGKIFNEFVGLKSKIRIN